MEKLCADDLPVFLRRPLSLSCNMVCRREKGEKHYHFLSLCSKLTRTKSEPRDTPATTKRINGANLQERIKSISRRAGPMTPPHHVGSSCCQTLKRSQNITRLMAINTSTNPICEAPRWKPPQLGRAMFIPWWQVPICLPTVLSLCYSIYAPTTTMAPRNA